MGPTPPSKGDPLKPLPLVRIPMLKEQVRGRLIRQWSLAAGGLVIGVGLAGALVMLGGETSGTQEGDGDMAAHGQAGGSDGDDTETSLEESRDAEPPLEETPRKETPGEEPQETDRLAAGLSDGDPSGGGDSDPQGRRIMYRTTLAWTGAPGQRGAPPTRVPPGEDWTPQPASAPPGGETRIRFGEARSFREALTRAGLSKKERRGVEQALGTIMDFRRCHGEDMLESRRTEDGTLVRFAYLSGPLEQYEALYSTRANRWTARRVEVPVHRQRIRSGGVVTTSLGDAFTQRKLGRSLVSAFVSAFERHANFVQDARSGDQFRIVVDEKRVDGEFVGYDPISAMEYVGQRTGHLKAYWFVRKGREGDYYDGQGQSLSGGWLRTPCRFDQISSPFDPKRRHPVLRRVMPHNGVDYAAATGTPVWAAAAGTLTWVGPKGPNGNLVGLSHQDGYESFYAHLHRFARGLRVGDRVEQRQVIGFVGTTGRSTGPHLHFGLKKRGRFVDPLPIIRGPGERLPRRELARFRNVVRRMDRELAQVPLGPDGARVPEP